MREVSNCWPFMTFLLLPQYWWIITKHWFLLTVTAPFTLVYSVRPLHVAVCAIWDNVTASMQMRIHGQFMWEHLKLDRQFHRFSLSSVLMFLSSCSSVIWLELYLMKETVKLEGTGWRKHYFEQRNYPLPRNNMQDQWWCILSQAIISSDEMNYLRCWSSQLSVHHRLVCPCSCLLSPCSK